MLYHTCPDHVEIDINEALMQMLVGFHRGRMIAIFPECPLAALSQIESLGRSAGNQLYGFRDDIVPAVVPDEEVNVIGGDRVIQNAQAETLPGLIKPGNPPLPVFCEFEQEFFFVAPMGNMPHVSGKEMSVCPRHPQSLND
jgi:hypothetical protein